MRKTTAMLIAAMIAAAAPLTATAQDKAEAEVNVTFVNKYMWRGATKGGFSVQPEATVSWKGAYLTLQGSKGLEKSDNEELDLNLGYHFPFGLNIGVTDYWDNAYAEENQYFIYNKDKTCHQLEGNIGYTCKYFGLQAYCMFWGRDYKLNGDQAYSTYIELSVPFHLGGLCWEAKAGMTPMESAGLQSDMYDETGKQIGWRRDYYYADGAACVMASLRATKELRLKKVNIPVFAELHTNPYLKTAALVAGVSIKPF